MKAFLSHSLATLIPKPLLGQTSASIFKVVVMLLLLFVYSQHMSCAFPCRSANLNLLTRKRHTWEQEKYHNEIEFSLFFFEPKQAIDNNVDYELYFSLSFSLWGECEWILVVCKICKIILILLMVLIAKLIFVAFC